VPFLLAGSVPRGPVIDGKLDDWPMRAGNARRRVQAHRRAGRERQALRQAGTLAFVTHTATTSTSPSAATSRRSIGLKALSSKHHSLRAVDGLREGSGGSRAGPDARPRGRRICTTSRSKANGVLLTERGVHTDRRWESRPPGRWRRRWPSPNRTRSGSWSWRFRCRVRAGGKAKFLGRELHPVRHARVRGLELVGGGSVLL